MGHLKAPKLAGAVVRELVGTSTAAPKAEEATGEAPQGQEAVEGPPERSKGTRRRVQDENAELPAKKPRGRKARS